MTVSTICQLHRDSKYVGGGHVVIATDPLFLLGSEPRIKVYKR
jgi:hypothetical protein